MNRLNFFSCSLTGDNSSNTHSKILGSLFNCFSFHPSLRSANREFLAFWLGSTPTRMCLTMWRSSFFATHFSDPSSMAQLAALAACGLRLCVMNILRANFLQISLQCALASIRPRPLACSFLVITSYAIGDLFFPHRNMCVSALMTFLKAYKKGVICTINHNFE